MLSIEEASAFLGAPVTSVEPLTGGVVNEVYLVQPQDVVVKVPRNGERWRVEKEAFVYGLVAALDVPFPRVVAADDVLVLTRLPGRLLADTSGDLSDERVADVYRQIGALMRRVHAVTFDSFGFLTTDVLEQCPTNEALMALRWPETLERFGSLGGAARLAARVQSFVDERSACFAECRVPVLCHKDFHAANVLVEGDRVSGVVDVENAAAGDPLEDVARALFYVHDYRPELKRAAIVEGYGDLGGQAGERLHLYELLHALELWNRFAKNGETEPLERLSQTIAGFVR